MTETSGTLLLREWASGERSGQGDAATQDLLRIPRSRSRGVKLWLQSTAGLLARESSSRQSSRSNRSVTLPALSETGCPLSSLTAAGPRGIYTPLPYQALAGTVIGYVVLYLYIVPAGYHTTIYSVNRFVRTLCNAKPEQSLSGMGRPGNAALFFLIAPAPDILLFSPSKTPAGREEKIIASTLDNQAGLIILSTVVSTHQNRVLTEGHRFITCLLETVFLHRNRT